MLWSPRKNVLGAFTLAAVLFYLLILPRGRHVPWGRVRQSAMDTRPFESKWTRRNQTYPVERFHTLPVGAPVTFPRIQVSAIVESKESKKLRQTRLAAIKQSFQHSWKGYRENAWLSDELRPVTGGKKNSFGHWAATLVDSLDSLWIMGLHDEFDEAVEAVAGIDFETSTAKTISVFETTIRYLGGMLSAYELSGREVLLRQATALGHMLYAAFDTPSRMPIPYFDWKNALNGGDQDTIGNGISADVGSLTLEFTKLSQLTGDMRFYDAVSRITHRLAKQQDETLMPGMWPIFIDPQNLDFASGNQFSLGAMADSLYEYLPKMHILLGGLHPGYKEMYEKAIDAAEKHLFYRPMTRDNRDILLSGVATMYGNEPTRDASAQHLACFVGGMVGMSSKLYHREQDLDIARRLADGCFWAYESMRSGIMPEGLTTVACLNPMNCTWNEALWLRSVEARSRSETGGVQEYITAHNLPAGFAAITDGRYLLRPEAIETLFYMYRITGDSVWQDKAWKMYLAIDQAARTEFGYSAIANVAAAKLVQTDSMESFWTAETLKYLYLIFSEPDVIDLDEWVLNTEAHPLKRALPNGSWW